MHLEVHNEALSDEWPADRGLTTRGKSSSTTEPKELQAKPPV